MQIKIIKNVIANIDGVSKAVTIGDIIDIDKDDADNLINGGYAVKYQSEPAVKVIHKPPAEKKTTIK